MKISKWITTMLCLGLLTLSSCMMLKPIQSVFSDDEDTASHEMSMDMPMHDMMNSDDDESDDEE